MIIVWWKRCHANIHTDIVSLSIRLYFLFIVTCTYRYNILLRMLDLILHLLYYAPVLLPITGSFAPIVQSVRLKVSFTPRRSNNHLAFSLTWWTIVAWIRKPFSPRREGKCMQWLSPVVDYLWLKSPLVLMSGRQSKMNVCIHLSCKVQALYVLMISLVISTALFWHLYFILPQGCNNVPFSVLSYSNKQGTMLPNRFQSIQVKL